MPKKPGHPDGWTRRAIGDVASVSFSSVDKKAVAEELPVRLCNYMDVWENHYIDANLPFMEATATPREIKQFTLVKHDVLLTKDSETKEDIADPAVVRTDRDDLVLGYHLALVRPDPKKAHGPFIAAQLALPQFRAQFVRVANGATRYGLGIDEVRNGTLLLPGVDEQKTIAEYLGDVDAAIDATRGVIEQTRRLKTAVLQDLLTRGLPGRHSEFVDHRQIGTFPAAWNVMRLDKLARVERGKFTHRPRNDPAFYGGDIPFVQTGDVVKAGDYLKTHSQTLNQTGLSVSKLFKKGTILFVIAGTVGEPTIASYDVAFPDSVVGITPHDGIDSFFLLRLLQLAQPRIIRTATESAQANINLDLLKPLPFAVPELDEQRLIASSLRAIEARFEHETDFLDQLIQLKTALGQALLTGRVRVPMAKGVPVAS